MLPTTDLWQDEDLPSTNDEGDVEDSLESWAYRVEDVGRENSDEEDDSDAAGREVPRGLEGPQFGKTTLMIRNVPVMYTQEMLLLEWPNEGTYDFLYLPRSCTGPTNLSYAFVNFVCETHAAAFKAFWQKRRLAHYSSRKALNISYAEVQGLEANLLQLKRKRVRRIKMRQCQPIVIQNGRHVSMEEAFRLIQGVHFSRNQPRNQVAGPIRAGPLAPPGVAASSSPTPGQQAGRVVWSF